MDIAHDYIGVEYDHQADALYIRLSPKPFSYSKRLDQGRCIDYSQDGDIIGVEILYPSDGVDLSDVPGREKIGRVLEECNFKVLA